MHVSFVATLKALRRVFSYGRNPFRVCAFCKWGLSPALPKRNPGLELANAFSVELKLHQYDLAEVVKLTYEQGRAYRVHQTPPSRLPLHLLTPKVAGHSDRHWASK